MAGTAVLERPMTSDTRVSARERELTMEERIHRNNIANNFNRLRYSDNAYWTNTRENERMSGAGTATVERPAPVRKNLFDNVFYMNGRLLYTQDDGTVTAERPYAAAQTVEAPQPEVEDADVEEPVVAQPFAAGKTYGYALPAGVVEPRDTAEDDNSNEDAMPTPRTMQSLHRSVASAANESKVSALTSLSTKSKVALATVAATVAVGLVLVCVNTGLIKSLNSDISNLKTHAQEQQQTYERLQEESDSFADPYNQMVREWAERNGMSR